MRTGPGIAPIAALAGDPARANMLAALLEGRALTASELAGEAGVTPQTASSHLAKLTAGGLIIQLKQGRHRYFRLADRDVALMIEAIMGVSARAGPPPARRSPVEPAIRRARACYDHLAGEMAVRMFESLVDQRCLLVRQGNVVLSRKGEKFVRTLGIVVEDIARPRRPLCVGCLDWSMRREHLAGSLGAALLQRIYAAGWATRDRHSRAVLFGVRGERAFKRAFGLS